MSKIEVDKVDPQSGTALEIGTSGDTITVPSGVTLTTTNATVNLPASVGGLGTGIDVTSQITGVVPTANLGSGSASSSTILYGDQTYKTAPSGMGTLLATATASNSAALEFTSDIDSTYQSYLFVVTDLDPASEAYLYVQYYTGGSIDTSSNYDYAGGYKSSVSGEGVFVGVNTAFIRLNQAGIPTDNEANYMGNIWLFNPASTVSYKMIQFDSVYTNSGTLYRDYGGGQLGTSQSTAVTGIKFYMSTGNISLGTIRMYGINAT